MLSPSSDKMYYKGETILKSKVIDDYLVNISNKYKFTKKYEKKRFKESYYLPEYSDDRDIREVIKKKVYEEISNRTKRIIKKIDTFFIERANPFGNNVPCINNAIFYCEVLGCNQIILKDRNTQRKWLIKKPVYIKKLNITIKQGSEVNCKDDNILCVYHTFDLLYPFLLIPQIRTQYIKDEILSNLPTINVNPDDLYIHLRGGDVFRTVPLETYAQPPLCFYERIINMTSFKNIYIIAQDKKNVVFQPLINKYPNIIYQKNSFEHDVSILAHAYNIVLSVSSFCISSIKFNDNLKNVYEYEIYKLSEMFLHLHHFVFKLNQKYIIHLMKPSERYASKMFRWIYSHAQRNLMLEENCPYDFTIIKPDK